MERSDKLVVLSNTQLMNQDEQNKYEEEWIEHIEQYVEQINEEIQNV